MANGYLGKISAVVSANTADFQSKLNASAKDVQAFARSVQSNLTSASKEAARSFEGIYTPLQKFERSLQAAASMKLSFKGFAGAVKDVDVLRQRLTSMKDSQVSLAVRASGMKNITELREALVGLGAKDLDIVAKVGGIEKVRELRALSAEKRVDFAVNLVDSGLGRKLAEAKSRVAELKAEVASVKAGGALPSGGVATLAAQYREATAEVTRLQEVGRQTIKTTLGVNVQKDADVDKILQAGERAEAIRLPVILDVLGEAAVKEAVTQTQRIRSVAEQINKPFGEATQKLAAMSVEIQAGFLPAMKRSQSQIESLKTNIERGVLPASAIAQQFDVVEKRASAAAAAVSRLAEASSKIGSMKTGQELLFARPTLASALDRGVEMGNKAAGLPASTIQANPRIAAILEEYTSRSNEAAAAYARLEAKIASGISTASAERQLESLQVRMAALRREFDGMYAELAPDRNADRIGESSPMDRNAGNINARTSLGAMGARTDISDMGRSSPLDRNFGSFGARTGIGGQGARTDISDMGRMSSLEDRRRDLARQAIGEDIEAPRRQLAALASGITSLKSQIDTLPDGLRTRFVPAIREAEAEFIRLSASPAALPGEIEAARQRLIHLTQDATRAAQAMNFSQSFGGAGLTGVNLGLDQRALQGYNAQLQILQGYMTRIPAEAAGPAVAAFNQLRNAIANAFDSGTLNTAETRQEIAALLQTTTQTTAALAGVSAGRIGRDIQRAGDIGRRGFDNMSLALNQAAFAIDDFMSSTGGLEFKLRAVSNNITQLAFILGGTTGLFIGLGAAIAGQAAVGLIKWINNGRTAEDQTKSLNEALARQKSLVEELAEAFRSLSASATRGIFSEQAQQARDFAREIENILKKQRELGLQRVVGNDPTIQRERAEQAKLRREIEKEENPAVRVGKQQQLRASEEREQRRTQLLGVQPPPSAAEIRREVRLRAPVPFRNAAEGIPEGEDVASRVAQADAIRPAVDRLKEIVSEGNSSFDFGRFEVASRQLEVLGDILDRLDRAIGDAVAQAATDVAKASRGPAEQIRRAQEEVAKAIELGIPGARLFGEELNNSAEHLEKAYKKLESAASGKDEKGRDIGPSDQKALVDAASAEVDALNARRREIAAQADAFRYERTVDPQRQIDARMGRATSNLGAAGLEDGRIARRMREIENERETIRQRSALPEFQTPEMVRGLQDAEQALNEEAAAIEAATIAIKIFADALNRASEEAKGNLNSAQQRADEARRADLGNSTPQTQEARRQAEADLERQREIERQAQTEIAVERDRLEQMQQPDAERMQQIDEQLKSGRELDSGLAETRKQAESEAKEAASSRKKFEGVVTAQKEFGDAVDAADGVRQQLGVPENANASEEFQAFKAAGKLDVLGRRGRAYAAMTKAEKSVGLDDADYGDAIEIARTELEAAIKREAEAANKLAEIDEKIAASGMSGDRETLIREREALQAKMEDDARTSQAKVDAARDASTREAEQAKAGERGRELSRTPEERFKAEADQGLADIQAYFERRAEANNGIRPAGDIQAQAAAEERFRKDREKEARTATSEGRGAELGMTERDRFRRDFKEGAGKDINARAKELKGKGEDPTAFLRQALKNQMESVAPMLQQFQEERQNAILQGPSRAALNVSDVSTTQGASELTRLLRGDDSAKDVNLAELQKQTQKFDDLIAAVRAANPGVLL